MRLAVIILGEPNSGKTSTLKHFINKHSQNNLSVLRRGRQQIQLNSQYFSYLKLHAYFLSASPSERNEPLKSILKGRIPEILFLPEQLSDSQFNNSISFLNQNQFTVLTFQINNQVGPSDWEKFNATTEKQKLDSRAYEILAEIRKFRLNNI
jgi:AAA+ ATPase superfamily predicted ATPase